VSQVNKSAIHCINPECPRPYPQPWGNKFCNGCGTSLQLLDRYIPLQPLGSGGFAQIFTVWDNLAQTEKVLKILIEDSPKALELFVQEADILCQLEHPGVPKVDVCGHFQVDLSYPKPRQLACLVMEKIDGLTLEEVQKHYPEGCPQGLVLNWLMQAVDILNHLHQRKIIHRDIKPSNIMLRSMAFSRGKTRGDQLVLIDFGGVKQVSTSMLRFPNRSTRLFSSGYSPPEQLTGMNIGPGADFYALGRTMIEVLTGKNPADLEDPLTGELKWRHLVNIKPKLGELLDEMVQPDVRSRPTGATIIQRRLGQISQASPAVSVFSQIQHNVKQTFTKVTQSITNTSTNPSPNIPEWFARTFGEIQKTSLQVSNTLAKAVSNTLLFTVQTSVNVIFACFSTIWAMLIAAIGSIFGATTGLLLSKTGWGTQFAASVSNRITEVIPNTENIVGSEILLFIAAGLGTAWGLTLTGVFGQKRQYIIASITSIIGYGLGWIVLTAMAPQASSEALIGLILVAVSFLTFGLGLRSHHLVYSIIAAFGTAITFGLLINLGFFPNNVFDPQLESLASTLPLKIIFFSLLAIFLSFYLAICHYLIIPWLRLLGWR
jgi:serine/threonine protein kinase